MGRLPEAARGQKDEGNQQDKNGNDNAVGKGQYSQMAVGLETTLPPFFQPADGLDPGHQQQGGQQVDAHVNAAFRGQVGEVGKQPRAAEDEYAPEVAVAEEDPGGKIASQPGKAHYPEGERLPVDVDAAGAGRHQPQV